MIKNITIFSDATIRQSMKALEKTAEKCLIVVNKNNTLLGTLSDGDLRNAILKGAVISDSITSIFQKNPIALVEGNYKLEQVKNIFIENKFTMIPLVDSEDKVIDVLVWDKVFNNRKKKQRQQLDASVVIMAGGKGSRLEPFTKILPKPLVPIREKPIIEHIIEKFTALGCNDFYLTVNYKSRILKAFFEELQPAYSVSFIEETEPLGTAGSLKFLYDKINKPFIVTNCDTIIKTDYFDLYEFHNNNNYDITLVASMKNYIIPYGTCELNDEGDLQYINEKPEYDFLVNTGLYVLNPDVLNLIQENQLCHITRLIEDAQNQGKKVGVFPIDDDSWIDTGQWAEYKKAVERL